MSPAISSRLRGKIREWRSKLALRVDRNKPRLIALGALGAWILAVLLAPTVHKRTDANGLAPVFLGLLAVEAAILAVYSAKSLKERTSSPGMVAATLGLLGIVAGGAGLLDLPLGDYRFAFAVAVACMIHGAVTLVYA